MPESEKSWAVFRQDFMGNEFLVEKQLTENRARELVEEYEAKKHHQHYWAIRYIESEPDYLTMLSEQLQKGTPLSLAIKVLLNQNATVEDCLAAIRYATKMDKSDAQHAFEQSFEQA